VANGVKVNEQTAMGGNGQPEFFEVSRRKMVERQLHARGISDPRVLAAFARVPRHEFVPQDYRQDAYGDFPIPIGEGQTISQPYIVAAMIEPLGLQAGDLVLEIGTGSGYETAVLAELVRHVYSVERYEGLAGNARSTLERLGYQNVTIFIGDGSAGVPGLAPFDAVIVSAAAPRFPTPLFEQLREGGRMIMPVGTVHAQELQLARKVNGRPEIERLEGCRFVPLVGAEGFSSA
jgi:protein-L-isoaspartate(D-aspartate) O-methyltransferase